MDSDVIEREIDLALLTPLVREVQIPPRPSLLADLQAELQRDEPDMRRLAHIASGDVATSAALLKAANSPLMGLSRRAETVEQAFLLLGMRTVEALLVEIALRQAMQGDGATLTRFWDVATKRSRAMAFLARRELLAPPDVAHTFGLFMDVGMALLMLRPLTPPYVDTLHLANQSMEPFTRIEQQRHGTDHTLIGAAMARTWGVSQTVLLAVRLHHDYATMDDPAAPRVVRDLIALSAVVEVVIQRFAGLNRHLEWEKAESLAMATLGLDENLLADWTDDVHALFDREG